MKFNIFIIVISAFVGFICSKASNIELTSSKSSISEAQEVISILREWKNFDTNKN